MRQVFIIILCVEIAASYAHSTLYGSIWWQIFVFILFNCFVSHVYNSLHPLYHFLCFILSLHFIYCCSFLYYVLHETYFIIILYCLFVRIKTILEGGNCGDCCHFIYIYCANIYHSFCSYILICSVSYSLCLFVFS